MPKENDRFYSRAKSLNPCQTKSGTVFFSRPRQTDDGTTEFEKVPLNSPPSRKYIKAIFGPLTSRGYLTDAEYRNIVEMIEGIAIEQPIRELSDCGAETIQQKPLLHGLFLLAQKGPFRATLKDLLAKIITELRLQGITIDDPTFPTTEDALGRQLGLLKEEATGLGLILRRNENDRPRTWSGYLAADAPPSSDGSDGDVTDGSQVPNGTYSGSDTTTAADTYRRAPLGLPYTPAPRPFDQGLNGHSPEVVHLDSEGDRP